MIMFSMLMGVYHYILNNLKESISILLLNIFMKNLESMMLVKFLFKVLTVVVIVLIFIIMITIKLLVNLSSYIYWGYLFNSSKCYSPLFISTILFIICELALFCAS